MFQTHRAYFNYSFLNVCFTVFLLLWLFSSASIASKVDGSSCPCTPMNAIKVLTITRIDSYSCCAACHTSRQEGDIEWSLDLRALLPQFIQVGKQWKINNGKWDIPTKGKAHNEWHFWKAVSVYPVIVLVGHTLVHFNYVCVEKVILYTCI